MKIFEAVSKEVETVGANDSIEQAAKIMAEHDMGFLPVQEHDRLVGTITDRDIVVRCLARGNAGDCAVRAVMTPGVKYCYDDEEIEHVLSNMGASRIRRVPVMNRQTRLVGIASFADVFRRGATGGLGEAFSQVIQPAA